MSLSFFREKRLEFFPEHFSGSVQAGINCSGRKVKNFGDFTVGKILDIPQ
jgi:hypothetical protein